MIDWMHGIANDWGRYMRKMPNGWPHRSLAGTMAEEGAVGAAIKCHMQVVPIRDTPADVLEFHNAWRFSEPEVKSITYVFYYLRGDVQSKAKALGISRATLYRKVGDAHSRLWSLMIDLDHKSGVSNVRREAWSCV